MTLRFLEHLTIYALMTVFEKYFSSNPYNLLLHTFNPLILLLVENVLKMTLVLISGACNSI